MTANGTILVVDDDTAHRTMLRTLVGGWGYAIEEADDGGAAIDPVRQRVYDLVLDLVAVGTPGSAARACSSIFHTGIIYCRAKITSSSWYNLLDNVQPLCPLLQKPGNQDLVPYLNVLRQITNADALAVVTADGKITTSGSIQPPPEALLNRHSLPYADFIALDFPAGLAVIGIGEVASDEGCEKGAAGRVIAVRVLDQDFMRELAGATGLEQSLIMDGHRVATSFRNMSDLPLNPAASIQVLQTREACCATGVSEGETYYVGIAPLLDGQGQIAALSEVALPANTIRSSTFLQIKDAVAMLEMRLVPDIPA